MKHYLSNLILFISLILTFSIFTKISLGLTSATNPFSIQPVGVTPININKEFHVSQDYKQIKLPDNLVSLEISGSVTLDNKDSFARVILKDKNDNEYLIYEASYPLTQENTLIQFTDVCEETCILNHVDYDSLRIELFNAKISINSLTNETDFEKIKMDVQNKGIDVTKGIDTARRKINSLQNKAKIDRLNKRKDKKWIAGETSISQLSYQEKKKLFGGELPNLYCFEYYTGGIFDIPSTQTIMTAQETSSSTLPSYFDWRYRHGADNPKSPYYNGYNGWLTPVKDQGAPSTCWAFSAAGTVEALINLYFNQKLDIDLSEQYLVSCSGAGNCKGGWTDKALQFIKDSGIVNESCFPYSATDEPCENCSNWQEHVWKISSMGSVAYNEEDVKKTLIQKGPLSMEMPWEPGAKHAIVLVGYGTIHEGDRIQFINQTTGIEQDLPITQEDIGKTYWIIKNSYGAARFGEGGYARLFIPPDVFSRTSFYWSGQPIPPPEQSYNITCVDEDGDGYCNWGLGEKPPICNPDIALDEIGYNCCSSLCKAQEDCDDSNNKLGPFTTDLKCFLSDRDVNKDCKIDILDIALIAKVYGKDWKEDVNDDGKVDLKDINNVFEAMNSRPGDTNWNPNADVNNDGVVNDLDLNMVKSALLCDWEYRNADVNNDGKIDIIDIAKVAKEYGKECKD